MWSVALVAFVHAVLAVPLHRSLPIVETANGRVSGIPGVRDSYKFLGIPFAQPPVANLRWKSPQPVKSWDGVRAADKLGASCMQTGLSGFAMSEDCLFLNIFAPQAAIEKNETFPVLVWYYGGAWESGTTSLPVYDGEFDASMENVVVVTVNYRLNVFGFLGSERLRTVATESTGNYGLEDQLAGLLWVQKNIAAFGGDSSRITIFGESAGGGSVACHLASPFSQGHFTGAIMESGPFSNWTAHTMDFAESVYDEILSGAHCADVACLRQVSADNLLKIHFPVGSALSWSPIVDGVFLPDHPKTLAENGKVAHVPVVIGSNGKEGSGFLPFGPNATEAQYVAFASSIFGSFAPKVLALYPASAFPSPFDAAAEAWGDAAMLCPARRSARWLAAGTPDVYLYHFTHVPSYTQPYLGSFHSAELPFVFQTLPPVANAGEVKLAAVMANMWARFAATGNPNAADSAWPKYVDSDDANFIFEATATDVTLSSQSGLHKKVCDFWDTVPVV